MVIRYWDDNLHGKHAVREDAPGIYRRLYKRGAAGIPASAMERYFHTQGFRTYVFRGSWQDLRTHLEKGRPIIVCLKHGRSHYTVVCGVDSEQGIVLINDPARRKLLKVRRTEFDEDWSASGNWTLLALP